MLFRNLFEHPLTLIVLIIVIIAVLGYKRLPDVARNLGRSSRILKSEIDEMKTESASKSSKTTVEGETVTRETGSTEGATRADDTRRDI